MVGHHNLNWSLAFNIPSGVTTVSDYDPACQFFLKLGLSRANGWDRDTQNVKFTVKCIPPKSRVLHGVATYLI